MRSTCTFEQRTGASSAATGQMTYTWAAVYSGTRCRLDESTGREFMSATGKPTRATHVMFLNVLPSLSITERDWRVDVGGLKYDILLIADAGGAGHHYEIMLERLS